MVDSKPETHERVDDEAPDDVDAVPGFAPDDIDDGRELYEWRTRWDDAACRKQRYEAIYLSILLASAILGFLGVWLAVILNLLPLPASDVEVLIYYVYAFLGGLLGGVLFDLKWLYHGVAKGLWNADRRYWRYFSPFISAAVAFAVAAFAASGVLVILDVQRLRQAPIVTAFSFVTGYFSDRALSALSDLADRVYGTARTGHRRDVHPPSVGSDS